MGPYYIVAATNSVPGELHATISGPGIPARGIYYCFTNDHEAYSFVENLNLSYAEAKRLSTCRQERTRRTVNTTVLTK